MLYTGKGDAGDTSFFGGCDQRFSKSSTIAEALGALDEVNSFLGLCKAHKDTRNFNIESTSFEDILEKVQHNLFIVQAQVAGAPKEIQKEHVTDIESMLAIIEKEIPPITSFSLAGGTEFSALLDVARTMARKAERRVVAVKDEGHARMEGSTLAYLNRLSSLLFGMVRLVNAQAGVSEEAPHYK